MIKKPFLLIVALIFCFTNLALAVDLGGLFGQVKSELLQQGVAAADVNSIQPTGSSLLGLGISKENLVNIVKSLVGLGVNGNTLNSPLAALKDLVQSGAKPGIASNLMSMAISQAKSHNLTGNAAVSNIVNFINQKKTEVLQMKQQVQGKIQGQKDKVNNWVSSIVHK